MGSLGRSRAVSLGKLMGLRIGAAISSEVRILRELIYGGIALLGMLIGLGVGALSCAVLGMYVVAAMPVTHMRVSLPAKPTSAAKRNRTG